MKNCDLCIKPISEAEIIIIPRNDFQKAVQSGFNPFKTPGINMSIITIGLSINGISAEQYFPRWRQNALNDNTDWGLCQKCAITFQSVTINSEMHRDKVHNSVEKSTDSPTVSNENIQNPEVMKKYFIAKGLKVIFKKSCPNCGVKTFVEQCPDFTCDKCGNIGRVIPVYVDEIE
jgi:hypothetical protein